RLHRGRRTGRRALVRVDVDAAALVRLVAAVADLVRLAVAGAGELGAVGRALALRDLGGRLAVAVALRHVRRAADLRVRPVLRRRRRLDALLLLLLRRRLLLCGRLLLLLLLPGS